MLTKFHFYDTQINSLPQQNAVKKIIAPPPFQVFKMGYDAQWWRDYKVIGY